MGKDGREGDVGRQANLEDRQLKLQALCLAALEIVLEDIEGHLDDGEVEHPDRQIAFTQISDFAQMSRVYSDI